MSVLLSEKTKLIENTEIETRNPGCRVLAFLAFLAGLLPALLHNFLFCESRIMLSTDGKHFLHTVSLLVEFLKQYAGTVLSAKFLAESQLPGHVLLDGPIMSLIYSPIFLLLNRIPTPRDWTVLAIGQSVFHGLSTAILTLLVFRLTRSKFFSIIAALTFGLYPPAVLQTGHFMSELPVTTILLLLVLCLSAPTKKILAFSTAGVCVGAIVLSKPALIPCAILSVLLGTVLNGKMTEGFSEQRLESSDDKPDRLSTRAWQCRVSGGHQQDCIDHKLTHQRRSEFAKFKVQVIGVTFGLAVTFLPWSIFSFAATGSFLPTAQRQPLYNVATGWNTEANGWAYNPHPPLTDLFSEADGPLATLMGMWIDRPQECFRLALSKFSRLCSCPWNDFKGRALGLDENAQILFHRLIIALAAFGAAVYAFCGRRYLSPSQQMIVPLSIVVILSHIAYLMVECQPRYAFTAVPFAIILAVYGIWQISRLSFQDPIRRLVIVSSVACALAATAFLLHVENFCSIFDPKTLVERAHVLSRLDRIEKIIDFSGVKTPAKIKSAILLIDGDKNLQKARVQINGIDLADKPISTMHFDWQHYALFDQLREFGPAMRISVEDFRQWRAVEVEPVLFDWHGKNRIILTNFAKAATVYGDKKHTRYGLSPDYCNYGILAAAPCAAGAESRYTDPVLTGLVGQESFILPKEARRIPIKNSLRIKLLVMLDDSQNIPKANTTKPFRANTTKPLHFTTKVVRTQFDPMLWDPASNDCLQINKVVLYAARTVAAEIPFNESGSSSHLRIRITGELKALKNAGDVGLLCALKGKNGGVQILGKTPRSLTATCNWRKFQIDDLVPLARLGGRADSMELALYPCPWMEGQYGVSKKATDALFRNIKIDAESASLPSITGRRIIY